VRGTTAALSGLALGWTGDNGGRHERTGERCV